MKKLHILSAAVMLSLLASTTPAAALSLGASTNTSATIGASSSETSANANASANSSVKAGQDDRDDDQDRDDNSGSFRSMSMMDARLNASKEHWKSWMFNAGITGTVTAVDGDTITIKGSNGTTYNVDVENANIRGAGSIQTGDKVYVQGVTNGTNIVATLFVDGSANAAVPEDDDKKMAVVGTVTAKSGSTLTVLAKNGDTYTVATADADIWTNGHASSSVSDIDTGDSVVVQGTVSGKSVTATKVYDIKFPDMADGTRGTVTAVSDNSFTLMVSGGTTYTVNADSASVTDRKGRTESFDEIDVGDTVLVTGDMNGTTIDADVVTEAKTHVGFFQWIGNFFKRIF